ncbi:MAG: hypothetical protein J6O61_08815 [Butyrivibrio sp.]|uniref:hypothetical protein n=1 Tax=Butyrivibrio sp. TaxID=28121 RepID=UPI001B24F2CF|nr:hypothetical protein [Butyrivibrio sp.]MBO6240910.1 hypothetical protein [Butyrivibrio sp.]
MKKKNNRFIQIAGCILMLAIGAFLMSDVGTLINKNSGNLEDYNYALSGNNYEDIEDGYYQVTIDAAFECFATEGNSQSPSSWYYAVWLDDDSIAVLTTDDKQTATQLDRICDETWAYLNYEKDSFTSQPCILDVCASGLIENSDLAIMYKQGLENIGITDENFKIRYSMISTKPVSDLLSTVIVGALIFLAGIVCLIVILGLIAKEKKNKLNGFDTPVMEGADMGQYMTPMVTKTEAKKRINSPIIKNNYTSTKNKGVFCLIAAIICIAIPSGLFLYNQYYSASKSSSLERYDLADFDGLSTADDNDAAELIITEVPSLIYSYNNINYYLVENEYSFIAIMDSKQFIEAETAVKDAGSFKLIGYLESPSTEIKGKLIDYLSMDLDDYDATFGKYMLHVQSDYNGSGFPIEKIETSAVFCGMIALFLLFFGIDFLIKAGLILKKLSYLSDASYSQMEKELEAASVRKYPQNLYLTENYIVLLHSFSPFKDSSNKASDSLFINYNDITWMYPSNVTQYGRPVNIGVTVYNKTLGPVSILSLPTNESNQNMIQEIFDIISQKNPGILFGYNEENQQKIGA